MRPWIRSLSNILPKSPLRDDFPAQNTILSAKKAPAGRFSCSKYNFVCTKGFCGLTVRPSKYQKYVSCYFSGLDIWNLKLFAIKNRLSIVPSLQNIQIMKFSMIPMSKNTFKKYIEKYVWPVLKYVKKYAEFNGAVHFAWNLQKYIVFDDLHFLFLYYFLIGLPNFFFNRLTTLI